jgi:hypothetical protein
VLRILTTGLAALREKAEEALQALGLTDEADVEGDTEATPGTPSVADRADTSDVAWSQSGQPPDLAIAGYDDLSASQIVDRLEGLADADLDAIRAHEAANRARNTILGKIDQLRRA